MKTKWVIATLSGVVLSTSALAVQGTEGHGGGGYPSHFAGVGKRAGQALKLACSAEDAPRTVCSVLPKYLEAIALADVLPRDQVSGPDGKPRDAINDGRRAIQLDTNRWPALGRQPNGAELQVRLSVHEYLGIAGVEQSDNYTLSDAILALLKLNNFSLVQIDGKPEMPPSYSRDATVRDYGNNLNAFCDAATKYAGERALLACAQESGTQCTVIQSSIVASSKDGGTFNPIICSCTATAVAAPKAQN